MPYLCRVTTFFVAKIEVLELIGTDKSETKAHKYNLIELYSLIDMMKGTILVNYKWTPEQIDKLELQDEDYRGLFFIYNETIKQIAKSNKPPAK